ncbi:hypothetical protein [Cupriavidus sp. UME77]|nr:hypothetical protein [Cupriavidus sp. UME77]
MFATLDAIAAQRTKALRRKLQLAAPLHARQHREIGTPMEVM